MASALNFANQDTSGRTAVLAEMPEGTNWKALANSVPQYFGGAPALSAFDYARQSARTTGLTQQQEALVAAPLTPGLTQQQEALVAAPLTPKGNKNLIAPTSGRGQS